MAALPQGWNFVLCHEGPDKTKAAYQKAWPKLRQDSATITELLKGPANSRKASLWLAFCLATPQEACWP